MRLSRKGGPAFPFWPGHASLFPNIFLPCHGQTRACGPWHVTAGDSPFWGEVSRGKTLHACRSQTQVFFPAAIGGSPAAGVSLGTWRSRAVGSSPWSRRDSRSGLETGNSGKERGGDEQHGSGGFALPSSPPKSPLHEDMRIQQTGSSVHPKFSAAGGVGSSPSAISVS